MHLQHRCYDITRVGVFYQTVCDFYIVFVRFTRKYSLDIFVEFVFFLFDNSCDIWDNSFFDIYFVYLSEVRHFAMFSWSNEGDCYSSFSSSSCSSDSVGVSFSVLWDCEIDNMGNIVYIDTSCCDICSYEDFNFFVFETFEEVFSLFLSEITVETFCTISFVV